jgi:ribonuclease J
MTCKLTFYGGVNEIGGNKILLQTTDGSILLDFGRRMGEYGRFFSEFLQMRSKNALRDMLRIGILPKIQGVYSPCLVDSTILFEDDSIRRKVPLDEAIDYWKAEDVLPCNPEKPAVDGVFISHAHFDHIQDVSFLDPCIPVYCTEKTRILAKAMTDVSVSGVDDQYYKLAKKVTIKRKPPLFKTLCPGECACSEERAGELPIVEDPKTKFCFTYDIVPEYRAFITSSDGQIKGIKYRLIPVGHSVPGACSILLALPDGKHVLYTGDVRFHGEGEVSINDYVRSIGSQIDILITEGTRVDSDEVLTEKKVGEDISSDIKRADGLVLVNFGWKDLTRFKTVHQAANENERTLVISSKLAYLLYEMHVAFPSEYSDPRTVAGLKVYLKREGDLLYSKADYEKYKMGYVHFHGRNIAQSDRNIVRVAERLGIGGNPENPKNPLPPTSDGEPYDYRELYSLATHHLDNGIRAYQIRQKPENYVLMFSYWDANELFDLIPLAVDHGTCFISASTEPFNEEMEIDETKMINWLDFFNINYDFEMKREQKIFVRRHVSGHASKPELKELIERINPKTIIPVHTTNSEFFEKAFPGKVVLPKYAQPIEL